MGTESRERMMQSKDSHEFSMLAEAADEAGVKWDGEFMPRRVSHELPDGEGRKLSALMWGDASPELVLFHGGAQNAHTWDTVAMALKRPLLAVDLPGHGHSDWREDHAYSPSELAEDVRSIVAELAPDAKAVAGMSLGGLTALMLADINPQLVRSLMLVDITPGVNRVKAEPILEFISGPVYFESFADILAHTIEHNPTRSEASLRRGILNNAKELPDGRWTWRWDPTRVRDDDAGTASEDTSNASAGEGSAGEGSASDGSDLEFFGSAWGAIDGITVPLLLCKGSESGVVGDEDIEELLRRHPEAEVVIVPGAGHSIQGDKPVELAALIEEFLSRN